MQHTYYKTTSEVTKEERVRSTMSVHGIIEVKATHVRDAEFGANRADCSLPTGAGDRHGTLVVRDSRVGEAAKDDGVARSIRSRPSRFWVGRGKRK